MKYVCGLGFSVSIIRAQKFGTINVVISRKARMLLASLKRTKATHARRGFLMDRVATASEFSTLEIPLSVQGMSLNVESREEHVAAVERHIRTIREQYRAPYSTFSFKKEPNLIIVDLVYCVSFLLHTFPAEKGVSV